LNTHRGKQTKIWSAESGYGFNAGIPIKWWFSEFSGLQTGVTFEYMAFDNRFNGTLISSNRYASVNVPVMFNFSLANNWYWSAGGGFNLNVMSRAWSGFSVDISSTTNSFLPYLGFGANTLLERDKGVFELGGQVRYHVIDLWKKGTTQSNDFSSKILSFDLILRFYLINK
jgi:hypothetical protein